MTNKLVCISGGKIDDIRDEIMEVNTLHKVANCIIHVGTNLIPEEEPGLVSKKLLLFLKEVRQNMPRTGIHFSNILPKYGNTWLPGIDLINRRVYLASNEIGYSVIPHANFARRGVINRSLLSRDGIHPSYLGVAQFARDIMH